MSRRTRTSTLRRSQHVAVMLALVSSAVVGIAPGAGARPDSRTGAVDISGCADPGKKMPVLFVHGFTGSPSSWGLTKYVPVKDYAVNQFDYTRTNTRWVTDPSIGDALATTIVCLATRSASSGSPGRVIVVGHSMGGLAARLAVSKTIDGTPVADRVAGVITIGTPYAGAWLANVSDVTGGVSVLNRKMYTWLRDQCPASQPLMLDGMCGLVTHLNTPAAHAMVIGSSDLKSLPAWPAGLPVHTIAGELDVTVQVLFGPKQALGTLGDTFVGGASGTAGFTGALPTGGIKEIHCPVALSADLYSSSVTFSRAFGGGGCTHGTLIRSNQEVIADLLATLRADRDQLTIVPCPQGALDTGLAGTSHDPSDAKVLDSRCTASWGLVYSTGTDTYQAITVVENSSGTWKQRQFNDYPAQWPKDPSYSVAGFVTLGMPLPVAQTLYSSLGLSTAAVAGCDPTVAAELGLAPGDVATDPQAGNAPFTVSEVIQSVCYGDWADVSVINADVSHGTQVLGHREGGVWHIVDNGGFYTPDRLQELVDDPKLARVLWLGD